MSDAVTLSVVWQQTSSELTAEIKQYWLDEGLVSSDVADQRADQVVVVARNSDNSLVALSSVEAHFSRRFQNYFYLFRTSVSRRAGGQLLSNQLLNTTYQELNNRYSSELDSPIGIMAVIENKHLARLYYQAVGARSQMFFAGYNANGQQIRLRYFEGATIRPLTTEK